MSANQVLGETDAINKFLGIIEMMVPIFNVNKISSETERFLSHSVNFDAKLRCRKFGELRNR